LFFSGIYYKHECYEMYMHSSLYKEGWTKQVSERVIGVRG